MWNVFHKPCMENRNTYFIFNKFFSENCTVYELIPKNMLETEGPQKTSQHGAYALRGGLARLHSLMCMHTPTRLGTHMQALIHAHAQRPICNTRCFFKAIVIRESASMLRYMYKVVQIWPGQTVTCLHTSRPGHIWTTLSIAPLLI
jgi:hypothetical protein